jgi:hypothetical protein
VLSTTLSCFGQQWEQYVLVDGKMVTSQQLMHGSAINHAKISRRCSYSAVESTSESRDAINADKIRIEEHIGWFSYFESALKESNHLCNTKRVNVALLPQVYVSSKKGIIGRDLKSASNEVL